MATTTSPRTRLVWKKAEIKRTAASLAAFATIGIGVALIGSAMLSATIVVAKDLLGL